MDDKSFQRFGGLCAIGAAVASFAFALALFLSSRGAGSAAPAIISQRADAPAANWLMVISGLLTTAAVAALYMRLREAGGAWALWGTSLGILGGAMTAAHFMWDALRIPTLRWLFQRDEALQPTLRALSYQPNPVDPRGLGSLLLMGIFVLIASRLILQSGLLPRVVGQVGILEGILLLVLFVVGLSRTLTEMGQLRIGLAALAIGSVGPLWWLLVGRELLAGNPEQPAQR